ncbi:Peptidase M16-like protein [Candidatus Zixiibacteriota bacterium]|nr:Peptidase M16-like protein [candidate division Zixibacteria bacterium]
MKRKLEGWVVLLILILSFSTAFSFDFSKVENQVKEYQLDNGLKIIVMPRHDAPVASFITMVNVGACDDPKGQAGIAHLFEHMAFKGTKTIGTTDYGKEKKWLDEEDRIYGQIRQEKARLDLADTARLTLLNNELQKVMDSAGQYVKVNEFGQIIEREGGVGLNAGTGYDNTTYYINYPANRAELWMAMESERFIDPVLRELYKEKQVIAEERRMSRESSPMGKLQDELLASAYTAHPYHRSLIGPMSDIQNFNRPDAIAFFKKYYVPKNMVVAIVGDVDPEQMYILAKKYFGRIPAAPKPEPPMTIEAPQTAERRVTVRDKAQPIYFCTFHIPDGRSADMPALEALSDYLGQGRTSLLNKSLVKEKKIAVRAMAFAGFPGNKYPTLFGIMAIPSKDHTNEENEAEVAKLVEKVKTDLISAEDMEKIKARAKATLINGLSSNQGLAMILAYYETVLGDWHRPFHELDRVDALTPDDIKRVANEYLVWDHRTTGLLESETD